MCSKHNLNYCSYTILVVISMHTCSVHTPQVLDFFHFVGKSSFYGAGKGESVESILLSILPSPDYQFTQLMPEADSTTQKEVENGPLLLLTSLINALQRNAGFHFIKVE